MLDGGTVFEMQTPSNWVAETSNRILLWENKLIGSNDGLSGEARKIQLIASGDLPS